MALWFPLRVNLTQIGHFEAQRIENGSIPDGGTVADAINTYTASQSPAPANRVPSSTSGTATETARGH